MHDNAPGHRAHATRGWLAANNISVFGPWPARSPDMSPIENLWAQLEKAIERRPNRPKTKHNYGEQFRRNGQISTCGMSGALSFQCAVDAQH